MGSGVTDHFEQAKDEILKQAKANGGVTIDHLLDALIATNLDLDEKLEAQRAEAVEKHKETKAWHDEVTAMVKEHLVEANLRDERLDGLERWRKEQATHCDERITRLIVKEHDHRHGEHMAGFHSADATFQARLVWFFATTFGKVMLVVLGAAGVMILNLLVWGHS